MFNLFKLYNKLGLKFYGVIETQMTGFSVVKIDKFEDKPHMKCIKYKEYYIPYEDISLFKIKANKASKRRQQISFEREYAAFPKENIELAEKLNRQGLIRTYQEYNDIAKFGQESKTYKELYEAE